MPFCRKKRHDDDDDDSGLTPAEREFKKAVIPALLMRSYHLPGYSPVQDYYQYMTNNHPVFGICCHHTYHPIKPRMRFFSLLGSVLFGLGITNIIYLSFVFTDRDYDREYVPYNITTTTGQQVIDNQIIDNLKVTNGNIALWTVGALLHAVYDNVIWSLAACSCCVTRELPERRLEGFRKSGNFLVVLLVIGILAMTTLAVTLRAALSDPETGMVNKTEADMVGNYYGLNDDEIQLFQVKSVANYEFVNAYLIELLLTYMLYYPFVGTVLFSGLLTCGRYPVVGGRRYELKKLAEDEQGQEVVLEEGKNGRRNRARVVQEQPGRGGRRVT